MVLFDTWQARAAAQLDNPASKCNQSNDFANFSRGQSLLGHLILLGFEEPEYPIWGLSAAPQQSVRHGPFKVFAMPRFVYFLSP